MSRAHNYNLSVHNQLDRSHVLTIKGMNIMCPGPDSTTACALSIASIYGQSSGGGVLEGEWLWLLIIHTYGNSMWLLCHSLWWRSDSLWLLPISSPKHTIPLPYPTIPYHTRPIYRTKCTIPVPYQNIHYKIIAKAHVMRGLIPCTPNSEVQIWSQKKLKKKRNQPKLGWENGYG